MEQPSLTPVPLRNAKEARTVVDGLLANGARFGAALRALEAHPGYRRLGTAAVNGATLVARERVRATTDELAMQLRAYQATLARAQAMVAVRGRLNRVELAKLMEVLNEPVRHLLLEVRRA